jgi:hypothetical protein
MKYRTMLLVFALLAIAAVALAACGGSAQPVTLNDIPAFTGAKEFKPGESTIGDTLAKNMQTNAALTQAMGTGGKLEQKGFQLPDGTTWDQVQKFYDDNLKAAGWGTNSTAASVLAVVNQQNDAFQTATYLRGNQTLAVIRMVEPISKQVWLFLSLNTH